MLFFNIVNDEDWQRLSPAIDRTIARTGGLFTLDDVRSCIERGRFQWFPLDKSFFVTEIVTYPREVSLRIVFAGGDLQELLASREMIAEYANSIGASRMEIIGRPGWARVFPNAKFYGVWMMQEI